jgi:hypothetical protein
VVVHTLILQRGLAYPLWTRRIAVDALVVVVCLLDLQ